MDDDDELGYSESGLYEDVGTMAGTTEVDGETIEIVGILFPDCYGGEEIRCMTLPCAKALLIDLREAIECAIKHKRGEQDAN